MLTEQRYEKILALLEEKGSITVAELTELLDISESTARRDITALDRAGRLTKVFGGAVASDSSYVMQEPSVAQKIQVRKEEKIRIARYAASLIEDEDFVYLDAGTTTGYMLDFLVNRKAAFVTNAVAHAQKLVSNGNRVFLLGGELKSTTEAVIGAQAVEMLYKYHFTKGFFGTNRHQQNWQGLRLPMWERPRSNRQPCGSADRICAGGQYKVRAHQRGDIRPAERRGDPYRTVGGRV